MVFDGDVSDTMRPGQILASDPTDLAPNGYLRVITGVSRTGSTTTVYSRQAVVTEAVRQADIDIDLPAQQSARGVAIDVDLSQTHTAELTLDATYVAGAVTSTFSLAGGVTVSVGLHIRLEIELSWTSWPEVTHFEAVAEAALSVTASETISAEFDKTWSRPDPLLSISLGAIPTPIPGVVITPELNLDADANVNISGSLSASFTTGKRFQVGVIYDGEDWEQIAEEGTIGGGFGVEQEGNVAFSAEAGISARLNISVNDTVGLYVQARAAIELTGTATTGGGLECGARLGLSVSAGANIEIPVIDVSLVDMPFGEIPLADWDLFNLSCPNGEPVETSVEGTGSPFIGEQEILSVSPTGEPGDWPTGPAKASNGGSIVAFSSYAKNLVPGTIEHRSRVFVRNVSTNETELVSVGIGATDPNHNSWLVDITNDGRRVLFLSTATNLVPGVTWNAQHKLYLYDRDTDTTEMLVGHSGHPCQSAGANDDGSSLSDDARFVLFGSWTACVAGDTNGLWDTFVLDRTTGAIERVSVDASGGQLSTQSLPGDLSADGRFATFTSGTTQIDPGVPGVYSDRLFRRDRTAGTSEAVSYVVSGVETAMSAGAMDRSGQRFATYLDSSFNPCRSEGALVDLTAGTTQILEVSCEEVDEPDRADLSRDGRYVSFADGTTAVIIDTVTGERFACPATGDRLSGDGRWIYGGLVSIFGVGMNAVRTRCR